ncbi:MAG: chorismate mutase [Acidithiobacillus caldus]|nr:chorismate mutase [Acidithiobacillus caldus]
MINNVECNSIEDVRSNIDRIDRQIVMLLAERGIYVKQAAKFKKTTADVHAPQRVEQVISKVVDLSVELGANPTITEQVYRAMISGFINAELAEHAAIRVNK